MQAPTHSTADALPPAVPFTPSQGIATPSPTNVAAHLWYAGQYTPHMYSQPGTPAQPYTVVWGPVRPGTVPAGLPRCPGCWGTAHPHGSRPPCRGLTRPPARCRMWPPSTRSSNSSSSSSSSSRRRSSSSTLAAQRGARPAAARTPTWPLTARPPTPTRPWPGCPRPLHPCRCACPTRRCA